MMPETTSKMDEMPSIDREKSASGSLEIAKSHIEALTGIRNNAEQIQEIGQSLTAVSHEIIDELTKILKLNNRALQLGNLADAEEIVIHPNGFIMIKYKDGESEPRQLNDLEPLFLQAVLRQLLPKLKASLDDRKRAGEVMLEEFSKIRDNLV
ncbi:MAG: hypothetical protein V1850_01325 [Candidatus Bathyarchaeota archaeon]